MPSAMTIEFPTAKVADRNLGDMRLWANPPIPASSVCHDKDAEKAPATKRRISIEDEAVPAPNPRMSVVK